MACKESRVNDPLSRSSREASEWMTRYAQMNIDMAQSAMRMVSPAMTAWMDWYQSMLPPQVKEAYQSFSSSVSSYARGSDCVIPETDCPPRCVCTVRWLASEGERRKSTIRIRNSSKETITYQFQAKPFESCGKSIDASPTVTPASISAAPGEIVTATIEATVGEQFHGGVTYHSEILVRGKYERCVKVELEVACDTDEACTFDHGDIPHRIRADAWYRHFQCSEPCFEPTTTRTAPATPPPAPARDTQPDATGKGGQKAQKNEKP